MILTCQECHSGYSRKPSAIKRWGSSYCSRTCMAAAYSKRLTGDSNPHFKDSVTHKCLNCNKDYRSYRKNTKFCSHACYLKHKFPGGVPVRVRSNRVMHGPHACPVCGKEVKPYKVKSCSRECGAKLRSEFWKTYQPKTNVPTHSCIQCGKKFQHYNKERRFCSYACHLANGGAFRAGVAAGLAHMKYGAKKDANHNQIVDALEKLGVGVYDLSGAGCGIPDCIVWVRDSWQLVEIKNPKTGYGKRGLNEIQKKWVAQWQGGPVFILRTIDEAIKFASGDLSSIERIESLGSRLAIEQPTRRFRQ